MENHFVAEHPEADEQLEDGGPPHDGQAVLGERIVEGWRQLVHVSDQHALETVEDEVGAGGNQVEDGHADAVHHGHEDLSTNSKCTLNGRDAEKESATSK